MTKIHVICAVLATLVVAMVETAQGGGSDSQLRWLGHFGLRMPYFKNSISSPKKIPFKDKDGKKCTFAVHGKARDVTIDVTCGKETKCSYKGDTSSCKKMRHLYYACIVTLQLTKEEACEADTLKCNKMCKSIEFKKT